MGYLQRIGNILPRSDRSFIHGFNVSWSVVPQIEDVKRHGPTCPYLPGFCESLTGRRPLGPLCPDTRRSTEASHSELRVKGIIDRVLCVTLVSDSSAVETRRGRVFLIKMPQFMTKSKTVATLR